MKTEQQNFDKAASETEGRANGHPKMSRREALALVGKHAVYTAPAVLAVLSATKSTSAYADGSTCPPGETC